jgi:hypothetical protein
MKVIHTAWAIAGLAWHTWSAAAPCAASLPTARVERVEVPSGEKAPQRVAANGSRSTVKVYDWLCPGDRFDIQGEARVAAVLAGGTEQVFSKGAAGPMAAVALLRRAPGLIDLLGDVLDRLHGARQPIALFNQARDPGQVQPSLQADPLLPQEPQSLPPGYARVVLLWRGGPAIVSVQLEGAPVATVSSGRRAYASIELPPDPSHLTLRLLDQGIAWQVSFDAPPPAADAVSRLEQALQILRDGPIQRRLFALSELALLGSQGNFAAEQLWAAARSGELALAVARP